MAVRLIICDSQHKAMKIKRQIKLHRVHRLSKTCPELLCKTLDSYIAREWNLLFFWAEGGMIRTGWTVSCEKLKNLFLVSIARILLKSIVTRHMRVSVICTLVVFKVCSAKPYLANYTHAVVMMQCEGIFFWLFCVWLSPGPKLTKYLPNLFFLHLAQPCFLKSQKRIRNFWRLYCRESEASLNAVARAFLM